MTSRKLFVLTAIMAVFLFCVASADTVGQGNTPDYTDDTKRAGFHGRLYIPDVGIDVALYRSNHQSTVDRDDSAAHFKLSYGRRTWLIADHNTQAFGALLDVLTGTTGYIVVHDGTIVHIVCVDVLDGHNTGRGITDDHGISVVGKHDYLMYTCMGYWRNVRICQWDITEKEVDGNDND